MWTPKMTRLCRSLACLATTVSTRFDCPRQVNTEGQRDETPLFLTRRKDNVVQLGIKHITN